MQPMNFCYNGNGNIFEISKTWKLEAQHQPKTDAMGLTWANVIPEPNFVEMIQPMTVPV